MNQTQNNTTGSLENTLSGTGFHAGSNDKLKAYAELTKVRISVMVMFTFAISAILAAGATSIDLLKLFYATIGMTLMAFSGNAMNMYLERYTDFLMARTARRPLPQQRLSATEVVLFATICFSVGLAVLTVLVNWQATACALATWFLYVWVYTPLKTRTWLNTEVGVIPGAMPILVGSLAATETVPPLVWAFFGVLLLWQFPHFMAIAWMYRKDYASGGLQMLTVVDPTGVRAGRKAIVTCIILIAISLVPAFLFRTTIHGVIFAPVALLLGYYYLRDSIRFSADRTDVAARRLLRTSIIYLPLYMMSLVIASLS